MSKSRQKAIKTLQSRKGIIARAKSQRSGRSSAHTNHNLVSKYHHTNLPCLRQSRRRQTSLALKAHRAFNLSKLGAPNCLRARYALSAQADRQRTPSPHLRGNVRKQGGMQYCDLALFCVLAGGGIATSEPSEEAGCCAYSRFKHRATYNRMREAVLKAGRNIERAAAKNFCKPS